ncbi:Vesicle transport protein Got1/SFT2-like protein [Lasiodiplodia theobromae]|uniref:Protein transport protein SFT2 n=1 Tax=Lasiodiplodia theobromae TaxID=45133 RepID=A0A5N5CTT7_9PEZI|nr:Vesicle transport protein Got1/SFT2-like protein [Lasiodiplodia theobromae]KAB2568732.1 Protein transport protein SFT2 [Lasiodiplodia theobromae]KAF4534260.1 Vesicle transport protein Got1/SFT2-like protein [Lasiodiplodia theobromae]
MASQNFRDSMNSLGWSRRDPDLPVSTAQTPLWSRLNPFGGGGYVRLPTHEGPGAPLPAPTRREEEEGWLALSRWDRMLIFGGLNLAAAAMFVVCFALMPTGVFLLKPRKFAILWTMGSVLFLASWAVMMGPMQYVQHLTSGPRLPFTATYFGSIALTLYFSLGLHSTILTLISSIVQLVCLLWYLVSYFPMGSSGLRFAARFGGNRVAAWMND